MNFNRIILIGNLTRDPVLSYTPSQMSIAAFGMAVNKQRKGKKEVMFVDCTAFGKSADNINKFFQKGDGILIEGELSLDSWTDKEGNKRSKHKVVVNGWGFVDGKKETSRDEPDEPDEPEIPEDEIPF